MFKKIGIIALVSTLAAGCASVPLENAQITKLAQQFHSPSDGMAGLYIYRSSTFGSGLYINVWVDETCIGTTVNKIFFYEEVQGGINHTVDSNRVGSSGLQHGTEGNALVNPPLLIKVKSGMHYFIQQNINFLTITHELVEEEQGKEVVSKLDMATKGTCDLGANPDVYDYFMFGKSIDRLF